MKLLNKSSYCRSNLHQALPRLQQDCKKPKPNTDGTGKIPAAASCLAGSSILWRYLDEIQDTKSHASLNQRRSLWQCCLLQQETSPGFPSLEHLGSRKYSTDERSNWPSKASFNMHWLCTLQNLWDFPLLRKTTNSKVQCCLLVGFRRILYVAEALFLKIRLECLVNVKELQVQQMPCFDYPRGLDFVPFYSNDEFQIWRSESSW